MKQMPGFFVLMIIGVITFAQTLLALTVTPTTLPPATEGTAYTTTLSSTGGTGQELWEILAGDKPSWLDIGQNTGVITGTPPSGASANSPYIMELNVIDAGNWSIFTGDLTLVVNASGGGASFSITTASLTAATEGAAYSKTLASTGAAGTVTWAVTGLPTGLSVDTATGTISGTPVTGAAATSPYTLTVTATDSGAATGSPDTATISLTVRAPSSGGGVSSLLSGSGGGCSLVGASGTHVWLLLGLLCGLVVIRFVHKRLFCE